MEKTTDIHITVYPFEVDFREKLTLPLLVNQLLNVAGVHADTHGFGINELNKNGHTWVLSRLAVEITNLPKKDEKLTLRTWVESLMRTFTLRNFAIFREDGTPIGYARSIWAMIDVQTRKPINLMGIGIEPFLSKEIDCPIQRGGKIPTPENYTEETFTVHYSDLDINKHLNSAKYVEHIMDGFSLEELDHHNIQRFEIEYLEECHFGDKITVRKSSQAQDNHTEHIFVLRNEKDEIVCKSKICTVKND